MAKEKPKKPQTLQEENPEAKAAKRAEFDRLIQAGETFESNNEYSEAILEYENALALNIDNDTVNSKIQNAKDSVDSLQKLLKEIEEEIEEEGEAEIKAKKPSEPSRKSQDSGDEETVFEVPYDPKSSYFFIFGVRDAGKTMMIGGLFYNLYGGYRLGDNLENINDHQYDYQKEGTILLDELLIDIPNGSFPTSTSTLVSESRMIPRQINLKYGPKDLSKPEFKFTLMDVSGEDLMKVNVNSKHRDEKLDEGIETFLKLPHHNLAFVFVYPAQSGLSSSELSSYMKGFLDELDRLKHKSTPMVFVVTKWDLVQDKYDSVEDFFLDRDPLVWNKINESKRDATVLKFSIGDVDVESGNYEFDPTNSNELFQWMYKTQVEQDLD